MQRVRSVAEEYLETAAVRRATGRPHVHHDLRCHATEQGFTLEIGGRPALKANLESEVWHVTIWDQFATAVGHTYESDSAFLEGKDRLLERLAFSHQDGFGNGKDAPADGRGKSPVNISASARSRDAHGAGRIAAPRQVKLAIYLVAFGLGLVFSALLDRHTRYPPAPPGGVWQSVARPVVAPASPRIPRRRLVGRIQSTPAASMSKTAAQRVRTLPNVTRRAAIPETARPVAPARPRTAGLGDAQSLFSVTAPADVPPRVGAIVGATDQSPRFHVQVGMFNSPENAQALVRRLHSLGYAATAAAGDTYRVWVGGYFDRETAQRLAANLRKAGFDPVLEP